MKRILRFVVSVILLCISVFGLIFFVWPSYQEFSTMRVQVEDRRVRLESGQMALAKLEVVQGKVFEHQEDFDKANRAIPNDAGLPVLYEHIQHLGTSSGLILDSIEGQAVGKADNRVVVLDFKAEFTGSYVGLKVFLNEARRSARILDVNTLDISSYAQDSGELKIVVELSAYAAP